MGVYRRTIPQTGKDRKSFQKRNKFFQVIQKAEMERGIQDKSKHRKAQEHPCQKSKIIEGVSSVCCGGSGEKYQNRVAED